MPSNLLHAEMISLNLSLPRARRPPQGMENFVGLKAKHCAPCEGGNVPKLSDVDVERLRNQAQPYWQNSLTMQLLLCYVVCWCPCSFVLSMVIFLVAPDGAAPQVSRPVRMNFFRPTRLAGRWSPPPRDSRPFGTSGR